MKPEGAVFIIRQTGMRAIRVEPVHQAVYESAAIIIPLVQIAAQKAKTRKFRAASLPAQWLAAGWRKPSGNFIEKTFEERPELPVCTGPFAPRMGVNRLLELTLRNSEAVLHKQSVNLALCRR